ncbi:MAG: hypothetical protein ABI652_05920 [Acidobacteriota bacterium]
MHADRTRRTPAASHQEPRETWKARVSRKMLHVVVLTAGIVAAGCGGSNGLTSPTGALSGEWTGVIVDDGAGPGVLGLQITQNGNGLSGTWTATFTQPAEVRNGSLGGSVIGDSLLFSLTPVTAPVCPPLPGLTGTMSVNATRDGARMTGTYVAFACTPGTVTAGRIDVSRH